MEHQVASAARLVHELSIGRREATVEEDRWLRQHFGEHALPRHVTPYVIRKHGIHVEDNLEWPADTTPEVYLASLRAVVLDERSGLFLEYSDEEGDWTRYAVGRVQRRWRGPASGGCIVVIFSADRSLWVTGFQPERGFDYVNDRDGFWIRRAQ